jgi:hypothetical protein
MMIHPLCLSRWLQVTPPAIFLVLAAGCGSLGGGSSHSVGEIHLFGLPTALTVAGSSVAGGVGVRIYASETGGSRGIPIRRGRLEVLMFDQSAAGLNPQTEKPLKVWSFEAVDLAPFLSATMMGTGYQLELMWDQARPKGKVFTVVARYRGSAKTDIYSTPAAIAVSTH